MRERSSVGSQSRAARLVPPLLLAAVTLWVYRFAVRDLDGAVLGGARVAGAFAWQLWWPYHCLTTGEGFFWTQSLMWPEGTFAFLHTPVNEGLGLLLQTAMEPWTAVNLLVLLHTWLAAVTAWLLCLRISKDSLASLAGALVYAFSYYALVQRMLGQVGIATLGFLPLLILAWLLFEERPDRRRTLLLACAWAGACLTDPYLAWYGAALPLGLIVGWRWARGRLRPASLGPAALALVAGSLPVLLAYLPLAVAFLQGDPAGGGPSQIPPLTAVVDPPFWHPHPWVQALRSVTSGSLGFGRDVGELQLYLGATVVGLVAWGAWRGWLRGAGTWVFLTAGSLVLALGPWLRLEGGEAEPLPVPLPYLLFSVLPGVSVFRAPNRAMVGATLGAAVLVSLTLAAWRRRLPGHERMRSVLRFSLPVVFLLVWGWEMAVWRVGGFGLGPVAPSPHYGVLRDARAGALLELPVTYDDNGYQSLNAHPFLLHQAYHRRPMAMGFTARYPRSSLVPYEESPFLFALTHPDRLERLLATPEGPAHLAGLARAGRRTAPRLGIRWYLLHTRDPVLRKGFGDGQIHATRRLLEQAFGPPRRDGLGNLLWEAYGAAEEPSPD